LDAQKLGEKTTQRNAHIVVSIGSLVLTGELGELGLEPGDCTRKPAIAVVVGELGDLASAGATFEFEFEEEELELPDGMIQVEMVLLMVLSSLSHSRRHCGQLTVQVLLTNRADPRMCLAKQVWWM
jgi:hypothetical protein